MQMKKGRGMANGSQKQQITTQPTVSGSPEERNKLQSNKCS